MVCVSLLLFLFSVFIFILPKYVVFANFSSENVFAVNLCTGAKTVRACCKWLALLMKMCTVAAGIGDGMARARATQSAKQCRH